MMFSQAYDEVEAVLRTHGFYSLHGTLYLSIEGEDESMRSLFRALAALKQLPWFSASLRQISAFRVEQWSNFLDYFETA